MPSSPQSESGSMPAGMGGQAPAAPSVLAAEQDWQAPAQALAQQTPSTQNPLAQRAAVGQRAPSGSGDGASGATGGRSGATSIGASGAGARSDARSADLSGGASGEGAGASRATSAAR